MLLPVNLLSGKRVEVALNEGSSVHELKQELGKQLSIEPVRLRVLAGVEELKDSATISVSSDVQAIIGPSLSWLDDGSECIRDLGGGAFVVAGEPDGLTGAHARCCYGCSHGEQYFEVEVLSGERLSVGVATREGFKAGLKLNAMLLNCSGGSSDGREELRHLVGEKVKPGDIIGVLLEFSGLEVAATTWQNGRCLGPAFSALRASAETPLYPVVSAFEPGDGCSIRFGPCPFPTRPWEKKAKPGRAHPLQGSWSLQSLQQGPGFEAPNQLSSGRAILLEVESPAQVAHAGGRLWRVLLRTAASIFGVRLGLRLTAVRTLGLLAVCRHGILPWTRRCGALWITSSFSSKETGGQADLELERHVVAALEQVAAWRLQDLPGRSCRLLLLTGPDAQLTWVQREDGGRAAASPCPGR